MTVFEALDHPWLRTAITDDQLRRIPARRYDNVRRQMHERIVCIPINFDIKILSIALTILCLLFQSRAIFGNVDQLLVIFQITVVFAD